MQPWAALKEEDEQVDWVVQLTELGMMRQVSCGIQLDINAALHRGGDGRQYHATLCDHSCTTENGHYSCPGSFILNPGVQSSTLATGKILQRGLEIAIEAVKCAKDRFLNESFGAYCEKFSIPADVARALASIISKRPIEINITGGNPELHPEIITILRYLHEDHEIVSNLTTTGRRFMLDRKFCEMVLQFPPDVLSLSADAFDSGAQVRELADKSADKLYEQWESVPATFGQRQKVFEAIYAAGLLKERQKPDTGFNLVVHPGNIDRVEEIIVALGEAFPGFHIFPYPAQTGFMDGTGIFNNLEVVEGFIDRMIKAHFGEPLPITRRLQYWLMLKAACLVHHDNSKAAADMIGGRGLWKCYREPGVIRYLQIGKGALPTGCMVGGGYLGCFWNQGTVTADDQQVWDMDVWAVVDYIAKGAGRLAAQSSKPCPGCGFPRLLFDVVSSEMGLNDNLLPAYLALRKDYAGY